MKGNEALSIHDPRDDEAVPGGLDFRPSSRRAWGRAGEDGRTLWCWGWADDGGTIRHDADLAAVLLERLARGLDPAGVFAGLNGNFAAAWSLDGRCGLAADQVRSLPLLYRVRQGRLLASDDLWSLTDPDEPLDPNSAAEYATAGFVTGRNTIYAGVRALQAGELVLADGNGQRAVRYYRYLPTFQRAEPLEALVAEQDRVVMSILRRAVESINGRQIVLPLSGGLDSRIIAAGLKRLGYDRVQCIAYGRPDSDDAVGSRRVAEALGLPWRMVPYEPERLRALLAEPRMLEFWRMCGAGVSMPFLNDYPALARLREERLVEPDAVFMPGQSGDFIVGTHLKYLLDPTLNPEGDVPGAIVRKHYLLWEGLMADRRVRAAVAGRMDAVLAGLPRDTPEERAAAYEYWEWQERQCKHVINEARCFEFFGYDWRMPLWDVEFMEYWRGMSLAHKAGAYLYREYLGTVNPGGVFEGERLPGPAYPACTAGAGATGANPRSAPVLGRLLDSTLGPLLRYRKRRSRHNKVWKYSPTGFARAYGKFRYVWLEPGKRHDGSLLLKDFLRAVHGLRLGRVPGFLDAPR